MLSGKDMMNQSRGCTFLAFSNEFGLISPIQRAKRGSQWWTVCHTRKVNICCKADYHQHFEIFWKLLIIRRGRISWKRMQNRTLSLQPDEGKINPNADFYPFSGEFKVP